MTHPKDRHAHQAFRSPFRSPRPSSENHVTSDKTPSAEQALASRSVDASRYDCQISKEEIMAGHVKKVTPIKSLSVSTHTTPQNTSSRHQEYCRKLLPRQFTSPFQSPRNKLFHLQSETAEEQLTNLIKQEVELDKDIIALKESGFKTEELQGHIDNLHRYNEIKDAAQIVLGRLAEIEQVTLKEIHKKYGVPVSE